MNLKTVSEDEVLRYFMECMKIPDRDALRELEKEWYEYIDEELDFEGETPSSGKRRPRRVSASATRRAISTRRPCRELRRRTSAHWYWRLMEKKDSSRASSTSTPP